MQTILDWGGFIAQFTLISVLVVTVYIIALLAADIWIHNRLDFLMRERKKAEHQKDYDRLAYVNDKIGTTCLLLRKVEKYSYFDFY